MKASHLSLLAVILICLVGIYLYQQRPKEVKPSEIYTRISPRISLDKLVGIKAWKASSAKEQESSAETSLNLTKKDHSWWVEVEREKVKFLAPAKLSRIKRLTTSLSELKGEKRASGAEILDTFSLKEDQALHLVLKSTGSILLNLLIGKRGPQWDSCFVRKEDSDHVYLVSKNLLSLFDIWDETAKACPEARPWVDLSVVTQGPMEIEGLSYSKGAKQWSLVTENTKTSPEGMQKSKEGEKDKDEREKQEVKWILIKNGKKKALAEKDVAAFLTRLFPLRALDVAPPQKASNYGLGAENDYGRFTIHLKSKGLKIIHTGRLDKKKDRGWIRDERGVIFEVSGNIISGISEGP